MQQAALEQQVQDAVVRELVPNQFGLCMRVLVLPAAYRLEVL